MPEPSFDAYLGLCGWQRVPRYVRGTPAGAEMAEDSGSGSEDGFSDDWGEEEGHFRISARRIRDYMFQRHELNNEEDSLFIKELEQELFGHSCLLKYVKCSTVSVRNFTKYAPYTTTGDEGVPHNSNDAWENYVHRKMPVTGDGETETSSGGLCKIRHYDEMLDAQFMQAARIEAPFELNHSERFRGNLLASSSRYGVTFVAYKTKLMMKTGLKAANVFNFVVDFEGQMTTDVDRENAVRWDNPYHINVLRVKSMSLPELGEREMLAVGLDDATVVLFDVGDILEVARGKKSSGVYSGLSNPSYYKYQSGVNRGEILPYFQWHMMASVWGVDMSGSLLVTSDNSHTVTLFDFGTREVFKSPPLSHNLPSVAVVDRTMIAAVTYDGIQYVLEVKDGVIRVSDRTKVLFNGWSCAFYPKTGFLCVDNFLELTGDDFVDQPHLTYSLGDMLLSKNEALEGPMGNITSHFGLAGRFHRVEIQANVGKDPRFFSASHNGDLCLASTQYHRRAIAHKLHQTYKQNGHNMVPQTHLLLTGTESNLGLWHICGLLNCAYTAQSVFPSERDVEHAFAINARINVVIPIPELQAVIVGSNGGYIELLRCVEHRGVYALRREWVLANVPSIILGVSVAPKRGGFAVYVLYDNYTLAEMWVGPQKVVMDLETGIQDSAQSMGPELNFL